MIDYDKDQGKASTRRAEQATLSGPRPRDLGPRPCIRPQTLAAHRAPRIAHRAPRTAHRAPRTAHRASGPCSPRRAIALPRACRVPASQVSQAVSREAVNRSADYYCAGCGTKALKTRGTLLSELPTRGTDGAVVVDEVELWL